MVAVPLSQNIFKISPASVTPMSPSVVLTGKHNHFGIWRHLQWNCSGLFHKSFLTHRSIIRAWTPGLTNVACTFWLWISSTNHNAKNNKKVQWTINEIMKLFDDVNLTVKKMAIFIDRGSISGLKLIHWWGTGVSWEFNDINLFQQKLLIEINEPNSLVNAKKDAVPVNSFEQPSQNFVLSRSYAHASPKYDIGKLQL